MYTGLAVSMAITGMLFWFCFKHYNDTEDAMNEEGNLVDDEEDLAMPVENIESVFVQERKASEGRIRYQLYDNSIRSSTPM
jgi:hypothetical protein